MNTYDKPEDYKTEVNELTHLLTEHDDFDMYFNDNTNIVKCNIVDESKDIAEVRLNGHLVCTYVYGGPWDYPTFVDELLLDEALTVLS